MSTLAIVSSPRIASRNRGMSLAENMIASVDSRLTGASPSTDKEMYVGYNTSTLVTARNSGAWCADIAAALTCMLTWTTRTLYQYGAVVIAPDVLLCAAHIPFEDNEQVKFSTAAGTLVERTIIEQVNVVSDIRLALLSSALPSTVVPAKVLSATQYTDLKRVVDAGLRVPVLHSNQYREALVSDIATFSSFNYFQTPSNATRASFFENTAAGDSGSGVFLIYNNQLVVLNAWWQGVFGANPSVHYYRNEINAAMTALGSSHQLTEVTN